MTINPEKLIAELSNIQKFHESNQYDPYNIGQAMVIMRLELKRAIDKSTEKELIDSPGN